MKIAVIGANGRSGQAFVVAALAAGHTVRAGVRSMVAMPAHDRLSLVTCDATKAPDILDLIADQDAVVSLIGHVKGSPPHLQAEATQLLINAMQTRGLKRLVSLTGTGVRFPGDDITLLDRILNMSIMLIDPARVRDGRDHVRLLDKSQLEWTVLRVLKLQNIAARPFRLTLNGPTKTIVGRAEVAEAILEVLEKDEFSRQAPMISRP